MRHAVILAGGGGTRLWPASRRRRPKQFLSLTAGTGESLLAATARRLAGNRVVVVTAADQVGMVVQALPTLDPAAVIAEPAARNTAAALGLAAVHLLSDDPDAVMGAIPADQHVADEAEFGRVVAAAYQAAEDHPAIVTVGLVPTRPDTGFGYLKLGDAIDGALHRVARFVEKPEAEVAEQYLADGGYLWNGGMFFVRAQRLLDEIGQHLPGTRKALDAIASALANSPERASEVTAALYPSVEPISIDYGVMEKATSVLTIPGDFGWSDVGSWSALAELRAPDARGNVVLGQASLHDADDNIVVADDGSLVAAVGVRDLIIVKDGDAVLVIPRGRAQDVRTIARSLTGSPLDRFL